MQALRDVFNDRGYSIDFKLSSRELDFLREAVRSQWIDRIKVVDQSVAKLADKYSLDQYHEISDLINHKLAWPKIARILPEGIVEEFRRGTFINNLESEFGKFSISSEEGLRHEEIYWRLVRPSCPQDVGPLHADAWFWELGHGSAPPNVARVKVWIALFCERGVSGFRYVRNSHNRKWPYHGERRDGLLKPVLDVEEGDLQIEIFKSDPGQAIVFNDNLLHGGVSGGVSTRISVEFTMFIDRSKVPK
jgi:hypothetical protein